MKNSRKIIYFVLVLILAITPISSFANTQISDISDHWAEKEISILVGKGLISGYEDGTFRPERNITRAEFMALINRSFNYTETSVGSYIDVPDDSWFADIIKQAKAAGYINGYADGTIKPNNHITRQEAAVIIAKVKGLAGNSEVASVFKDIKVIPKWSKAAIGAVVEAKIMSGYPDGYFRAESNITRAEAAAALNKAIEYTKSLEPSPSPAGSSTSKGGTSQTVYTYDSLISSGVCLRPFTLLGYIVDNKMNLINVSPDAKVFTVKDPVKRTYVASGKINFENFPLGNFVELWDSNNDKIADIILSVPRNISGDYWDQDMYWLPGVGEKTDPSVDDMTGEEIFGKEYVIPMGERQLEGYGIGNWSGTTDFANLDNETYWPFIDYYNASSSESLKMLTGYRSALQATGGTCGVTSAMSALDWFGVRDDLNEKDLGALRSNQIRWGGYTTLSDLIDVFTNLERLEITGGWDLYSSYDDPYGLFDYEWVRDTIAGGSPIMVGWQSFGAHWQVIIGYDDMGTEQTNDDVLIMMDPYDSTDHLNDGYTIQSYERLAYGIGLRDNVGTDEQPFYGTNYLVATPKGWEYEPVMGEGILDNPTNLSDFSDSHKIPYGDAADDIQEFYPETPYIGENGLAGAATGGYERSGDYNGSPYYKFYDIHNMESNESLTLLEKFKTSQQVTEWSCGLSTIFMAMEWFDMNDDNLTELDLAQMRQGGVKGATTVKGMEEVFENLNDVYDSGWEWFTMRDVDSDYVPELIPELLKEGIPMMIGWDEWGGHWQIIIGYDDMGTPETQDDVLILVDPYDTTDHNQDGYFLEQFERLVYGWTARFDTYGSFIVAYPSSINFQMN